MELISREEAMQLLKEDYYASRSREEDERAEVCLLHLIDISNLPAVEERKEGRWVRITQDVGVGPHLYKCSECHRVIEYSSSELSCLLEMKFPYCHCGAKMRGE